MQSARQNFLAEMAASLFIDIRNLATHASGFSCGPAQQCLAFTSPDRHWLVGDATYSSVRREDLANAQIVAVVGWRRIINGRARAAQWRGTILHLHPVSVSRG